MFIFPSIAPVGRMGTGLRPGLLTFDTLNIGVPVFFIQQVRIIIGLAHLLSSPVPAELSRAGGAGQGLFGDRSENIILRGEKRLFV